MSELFDGPLIAELPDHVGISLCRSCKQVAEEAHPGYGEYLTIIGYKAEFKEDLCRIPNGSVLLGAQDEGTGPLFINAACDVCGRFEQWLLGDLVAHLVKHAIGQSTWEDDE